MTSAGLYVSAEDSQKDEKVQVSGIPWHVLTATPALIVMVCHAAYNFGRYFLYY
eukprot:SAG31_NODE_38540_length_295_cov_1.035714_1_plen_53_part_10